MSLLGEAMTTIVVQNPRSMRFERYNIAGLTPEELEALPLDERVCEEVAAIHAPCLPEEFLAAYVIRVGVVAAGRAIVGAWIAHRLSNLFAPLPGAATRQA